MDRAFEMKKREAETGAVYSKDDFRQALRQLESAPLKEMFDTYVERINSRGELGVLSSLNQRLWWQHKELADYLNSKLKI
jgi:hypothetical protein